MDEMAMASVLGRLDGGAKSRRRWLLNYSETRRRDEVLHSVALRRGWVESFEVQGRAPLRRVKTMWRLTRKGRWALKAMWVSLGVAADI